MRSLIRVGRSEKSCLLLLLAVVGFLAMSAKPLLASATVSIGEVATETLSQSSDTPADEKADEETAQQEADKKAAAEKEATAKAAAEKKAEAKKKAKADRARRAKARAERKAEEKKKAEAKRARFATFTLSGALPESPEGGGPFSEASLDLRKFILRLDRAAADEKIRGVVLRLRDVAIGGGQRYEIRQAIQRVRASGKRVIAEMEVGSGASYLLACACDEIIMPESGYIMLPGIRAEPLFYKGMLAKLGVEADVVHVGDAKGAGEPYTRAAWSEPVKKNLTSMIDDLFDQMVDTIAMDRPMSRQAVIDAIDRGLMTSTKAKELGLIDRLAYSSELRNYLLETESDEIERVTFVKNYGQKEVDTDFSGPGGFFKLLGMIAGKEDEPTKLSGKKIAIVYAVGPIATGKSQTDMFGSSSSIGSTSLIKALDDAASDEDTAAIILRVNSPGGSAVASDLIWNKIEQIKIPVVASMGDTAASGGYYISMGADTVFAEPTTVTGSIGVVGGKVAVRGLLNKLGVTSDLISRGKNSGLFSPYEKFTDSERASLLGMMEETYDQFTAKAAQGRGLSQERIKELGGGRVYTGRQAKKLGLIDKLGDLKDAIAEAKRLAGIDADQKVQIETYPEAKDFFETLFGGGKQQQEVQLQIDRALSLGGAAPELLEATRRFAHLRQLFLHEPVALIAPFELKIAE